MLIDFFFTLKDAKIPVTIKEFLTLLEAMEKQVLQPSLDLLQGLEALLDDRAEEPQEVQP